MRQKAKYMLPILLFLLAYARPTLKAQKEDTEFYTGAQLVSFEDLTYPGVARMTRIQGIVVVKADLDEKGNVTAASALTGPKPLLVDSVANAKKWKFKPSSERRTLIVYEFRLDDGACNDASHSLFRLVHPNFATITACTPTIR